MHKKNISTLKSRKVEFTLPHIPEACLFRMRRIELRQVVERRGALWYTEEFKLGKVTKLDDARTQFEINGMIRDGKVKRDVHLKGILQKEGETCTRLQAEVPVPFGQIGCIVLLCSPGLIGLAWMLFSGHEDMRCQGMLFGIILLFVAVAAFLPERRRYLYGAGRILAVLKESLDVHD